MLSILCNLNNGFNKEYCLSEHYDKLLIGNEYETILNESEIYRSLIQNIYDASLVSSTHSDIIDSISRDTLANSNELIAVGIACLQSFVQSNWLGKLFSFNYKIFL